MRQRGLRILLIIDQRLPLTHHAQRLVVEHEGKDGNIVMLLGGQLVEEDQHIAGLVAAQRLVFVHGHGPEMVDGDEDTHIGVDGGGGLPGYAQSRGVLGHVVLHGHLPRVGPDVARVHLVAHDHAHHAAKGTILTGVTVGQEGDEGAVVGKTLLGDQVEGRDQTRAVLPLARIGGVLDDLPEGGVDVTAPMGGIEQDEGDHAADLGKTDKGLIHLFYVRFAEIEGSSLVLEENGIALLGGGHEEVALVDVDGGVAHAQLAGILIVHHLQTLFGVHHGVGEASLGCGDGLHVLFTLDQAIVNRYAVGEANAVPSAGKAGDGQDVSVDGGGQESHGVHFLGQNGGEGNYLHGGICVYGSIQHEADGIGGGDDGLYGHGCIRPFSDFGGSPPIL